MAFEGSYTDKAPEAKAGIEGADLTEAEKKILQERLDASKDANQASGMFSFDNTDSVSLVQEELKRFKDQAQINKELETRKKQLQQRSGFLGLAANQDGGSSLLSKARGE